MRDSIHFESGITNHGSRFTHHVSRFFVTCPGSRALVCAMSQDSCRPTTFSPARQPFLYLTAALLAGILLDRWVAPSRMILIALVVLAIPMSINFILVKKAVTATAALLVSLAATGALLSRADQAPRPASRLGMLYESHLINARDPVELTGVLSAPPEPAPFSYYLDLDAECIRVRDERQPAEGRVRLMISLFDKDGRAAFAA